MIRRLLGPTGVVLAGVLALGLVRPPEVHAYVEAPHSLGQIVNLSSNILIMRVEAVDKGKNAVIFRKVRDLKGVHQQEVIRHNIGQPKGGFEPREWTSVMNWADVGKLAVFCHNGTQSETCIGVDWYQTYGNHTDPNGWWEMTHGEPFLRRSYAGSVDKLISAITAMLAGQEVIVPCLVDGNAADLKSGRARVQRVRASLKLNDYNPKRDFVGWGGEDFRRLQGMPGFTHLSGLPRVDPDAQAVSAIDFNGDGKMDLCLAGAGRVALLQNSGEALGETSLPGATGCRSAVWADYNGDGKPDLLLATPTGPKLYTNTGDGFRDDSHLLPREPGYNLTAAAWVDQDGDGRPDILLGNGFHGLRLYRNKGKLDAKQPIRMSDWMVIGPFSNTGNAGFARAYPPEMAIDFKGKYPGKGGKEVAWREGKFTDGQANNLAIFDVNENAVCYVHRTFECAKAMELPVSLGSDDGLAVWLNGEKIVSQDGARVRPDQATPTLKLKAGRNDLLMKVTQGNGQWEFYFQAKGDVPRAVTWTFQDVSDEVGLGERGLGSREKGDTLTVCDVDGDGRPDFLYGSGRGLLALNTPKGFVAAEASGIDYRAGKVGPVFADVDGDGLPDLLVPQGEAGLRLFRNKGKGQFEDVTEKAGLGQLGARVACVAVGDLDNDGQPDLVVGCLRSPNRFLRNKGDGTFEDASGRLGLDQRVFNTQAAAVVDVNGDGVLDLVFNNEGQDPVILLGNPETLAKHTPVTLQVATALGAMNSRVNVRDKGGKLLASQHVSGGEGRGGQSAPQARFALPPGTYRVELLLSNGEKRGRELVVAATHVKAALDDKLPRVE